MGGVPVSAIVRPYRLDDYDWEGVQDFLLDEADALNRDRAEIDADLLLNQLERADIFLIAKDEGRIVGIASIRRGATVRDHHVGMLRLHVREANRSNGVGAKLLRRVLWWADRNGITRVVAMPYIDSGPLGRVMHELKHGNIAFFERHGFKLEGVQRKAARLLDGTYTDVALMARVIQP